MTPPADQDLVDFAVGLARRAGDLVTERFFAGTRVSFKPDGTEVTEADLAVEALVRTELADRFPRDEVYGEELGTSAGTSGRRWVVDPIDGTYYFAHRIPVFSTRIAFEDEHGPAIGVIHEPVARQTIYAGRGRGCWRSIGSATTPTRVGDRVKLSGARTAMINPGTWSEELLTTLHRTVFLQTTGDIVGLVTGRVDAVVIAGGSMDYEDLAPIPVIVTEAGGVVTTLTGGPVLPGCTARQLPGAAEGPIARPRLAQHDPGLVRLPGISRCRWVPAGPNSVRTGVVPGRRPCRRRRGPPSRR